MNIVFLALGHSFLAAYHCIVVGERLNYLWKIPVTFVDANRVEERRKIWRYSRLIEQNHGAILTYGNVTRTNDVKAYLPYADLVVVNIDLEEGSAIDFFKKYIREDKTRVKWVFGNMRSVKLPAKQQKLRQWRIDPKECEVIPYNALMVENYNSGQYVQELRNLNPWRRSPMQDIYLRAIEQATRRILVTAENAEKEVV